MSPVSSAARAPLRNLLWAALLALGVPLLATPETSTSVTVVKAAHLLDPRTGSVVSPAAVLVEGNKIKDVGPPERIQSAASSQARVIDLGAATLLPGLIDGHTHLFLDIVVPPGAESRKHNNGVSPRDFSWRSPNRRANASCWGRRWRARTWKAGSPRCAISVIPESTATPNCAMRSTRAA